MSWTTNNILQNHGPYTQPKEIFQAVCDELGVHYSKQGYKYARSRPRLTFTRDALKLDINFWSARHNNAGEHVQLEIVPALFSLALASAGNGKGGIASVPALLEQSCEGEPGYTVRHDIFGETKTWIDGRKREPVVKRSNRCNVYGVDEQKFKALVSFLDEHVVTWVERMQREDDVVALIERQTKSNAKSLLDGAFAAYVEMAFPALDVRARLTDVIESRR